jgi:hypothetical protein
MNCNACLLIESLPRHSLRELGLYMNSHVKSVATQVLVVSRLARLGRYKSRCPHRQT